MRQPVTIYTLRNGNPWVMFGKHYGGDTPYADTGRTFIEQIAMHGSADVAAFTIEDGPQIDAMTAMFDRMEKEGVVMMIDRALH